MRIALNCGSISSSAMSGLGHYTACLLRALLQYRETEALSLVGGGHLGPFLSPGRGDRLLTPGAPPGLWEQPQLPELLAEEGADLYHSPALGLPLLKPCPCLATVHDCLPRVFPELAPPWLVDFFEREAPGWLARADHLICVSHHTAHDLRHLYGIPPEKMTVVYQAVGEVFRPVAPEKVLSLRKRLGLDRPYFLVVGRVELPKNTAGVLKAFGLLQASDLPPHLLVLAGPRDADTYDPDHVLPPQGRHGDVLVTGYLPDEELAALLPAPPLLEANSGSGVVWLARSSGLRPSALADAGLVRVRPCA